MSLIRKLSGIKGRLFFGNLILYKSSFSNKYEFIAYNVGIIKVYPTMVCRFGNRYDYYGDIKSFIDIDYHGYIDI